MSDLLQYAATGIALGSIYALVALGFETVFAVTGAINFAQGEFVMLGAMIAAQLVHAGMPLPLAAVLAVAGAALAGAALSLAAEKSAARVLGFTMKSLGGQDVDLDKYQGKVVMIVNVASKCGLTPQYKQLQALHDRYGKEGLAILGFPCNQFRQQEPGTADEIRQFCRVNYGVRFDMFAKVEVNGPAACDLYKCLTSLATQPVAPGKISWNFEKFLVGRNGQVVARFAPRTKPDDPEVLKVIEAELARK